METDNDAGNVAPNILCSKCFDLLQELQGQEHERKRAAEVVQITGVYPQSHCQNCGCLCLGYAATKDSPKTPAQDSECSTSTLDRDRLKHAVEKLELLKPPMTDLQKDMLALAREVLALRQQKHMMYWPKGGEPRSIETIFQMEIRQRDEQEEMRNRHAKEVAQMFKK